jgi:hypothetical protein
MGKKEGKKIKKKEKTKTPTAPNFNFFFFSSSPESGPPLSVLLSLSTS